MKDYSTAQEREFKNIYFVGDFFCSVGSFPPLVSGIKAKRLYSINVPFMYPGLKSFRYLIIRNISIWGFQEL